MLPKIFWFTIFFCLSVFAQIIEHNTGIDPNDPKYRAADRRAYFDQQLKKAKKVVDLTQDPEAMTVYSFLANEGVIVAPIVHEGRVQIMYCEAPISNHYVAVSVIFQKDLALDQSFLAKMSQETVGASYNPSTKVLILKEWADFSDLWSGLILLHEARHAYESAFFPYDWRNPQIYCEHERTTHEFENRLIAKIGGAAYQRVLSREEARIARSLDSCKTDWKNSIVSADKMPGLAKIFGPSVSRYENDARYTHIWIDAYFHFLEGKCSSPQEAIAAKDWFLLAMYRQAKILY